jgi:DnaJ-class molecular chaperone
MRDPYEALGVSPDASQEDIKKSYRKLAKRYHPDTTGGDKAKEDRFKEISTAYDIVGDPEKRAKYDAMRQQGFSGLGGAGPEGPSIFDLGELFAQMFGGGGAAGPGPAGGGRGGPRVQYRVYTQPGGGGFRESFSAGEAPFGSPFDFSETRPRSRPRAPERKAERVVRTADGARLTQRGADMYSDARIELDQAVLGTVTSVPTLDGRASVKIPPGTSSGVKLRLKGKGAERPGGGRGDHFVTVHIDVPKQLDEESRRLITQFMARVRATRGEKK